MQWCFRELLCCTGKYIYTEMYAAYLNDLPIEHLNNSAVRHLDDPSIWIFELKKLAVWQLNH